MVLFVVFGDNSENQGTINGAVIFEGYSGNSSGSIVGSITFREFSTNSATIVGQTINVYYPVQSPIGGDVSGSTVTYHDYPRTLYFCNTNSDGEWNNVSNWFDDQCSTSASSIPTAIDDVHVIAEVLSNSGPQAEAGTISVEYNGSPIAFNIPATVINGITVTNSNYLGPNATITGDVVLNDSSHFEGTITGTVTIHSDHYAGGSPGSNGLLAISNGNWKGNAQGGVIGNDAVPIDRFSFSQSAVNQGTITGDTGFADSSYNVGTINGDAYFNINGYYTNGFGSHPDTTFLVNNRSWQGNISGTIYNGELDYVGSVPITLFEFHADAGNEGIINYSSTFFASASNTGTINGDVIFESDSTGFNNGTINGNVAFSAGSSASNYGTIIGDLVFNGGSQNGNVVGNVTFNDNSYTNDLSNITGNVTVNGNGSANVAGLITGTVTFNDATTPGSVYDADLVIDGNAIFVGDYSEFTRGTISGTKTRLYTTSTTTTRNFVTDGPWTVVADGSGVVVDVTDATFDETTTFSELNGGTFVGGPPPVFYFSGSADHDWNNLNNWYLDSDFSIPASTFPTTTDNVVLYESITSNSGLNPSINRLTFGPDTIDLYINSITITVAENVILNNSNYIANGTVIIGNVVSNDTSFNTGTIHGNLKINSIFHNPESAPVNGIFISGLHDWIGEVDGTVHGSDDIPITEYIFNEGTGLASGGVITGNVTLNDTGTNNGTINGDATFHTTAYNNAEVEDFGTLIVNNQTWFGSISGDIYNYNAELVNHIIFKGDNGNNNMDLHLDASFFGTSGNYATIDGNVDFNDSSTNNGTINGNVTFLGNYSELLSGSISGTKTRLFTTSTTTTRNFVTDGPWTIVANGGVVNVANATYDNTTTFSAVSGGSFIYPTYTLSYTAGAHGTLTGSTTQIVVKNADGSQVTPVPAVGYYFANWSDASTANPRRDTEVNGNVTVTANFLPFYYTVSYVVSGGSSLGSISGSSTQIVQYGSSGLPVTAVPASGNYFVNWLDSSTQNPRTETNVTGNISATAVIYVAHPPTIIFVATSSVSTTTATLTENITVTELPTTDRGFNYGLTTSYGLTSSSTGSFGTGAFSKTLTGLTCGTIYHFRAFAINSVGRTNDSDRTFTTSACTYRTLTYSAGSNGSLTGSTTQVVLDGADGSAVTAIPDSGYTFSSWSDASTDNPRTDTSVSGNITVTANFAAILSQSTTQPSSRSGGRSGGGGAPIFVAPITNSIDSIIEFLKQLFGTNTTVTIPDTTTLSTPSTQSITKPENLTSASIGGQVTSLQSFLIEQGSGPEAQKLALRGTTGYFGALTKSALSEYQKAHGILPSYGYFGPLTKAYLEKKGIAWWK